jgi:hypothetical protein
MLLRVGGTNYTVYHSGNIPAYLTALSDTLATVTARGATTSTLTRFNNQLQVGQNTNGTAWIDAYGGFAYYGADSNSTGMKINSAGTAQFYLDARAPIFYDSNDTGYYVNPNSSSLFSSLAINSDFRTGFISGAGGSTFSANHYSMGKDIANGGWSGPHYSDLIIGYHTGVRIGGAYSGVRFYANSPTTDANNDGNGDGGEALLMTVGGYVGTANSTDVYVNNNLFAGSSMRAPIYYDSNDTTYYVDPNSTGVALRIAGAIQGNHVNWTGEHNKIQWHSNHMYFQNMNDGIWIFRNSNGAEPILLYASGYGYATGSWRAPLFYDSNDTSYYVDPNGTSELSGLSNGTKVRAGLNIHYHNRQGNTADTNYWVGSQGWGESHTWNSALTTLGSCFMDLWGSNRQHPQGNGYVHAQGLQILHYRDGGGADTNTSYGWQMVGAADAGNRWWLRGKWGSTIKSWYEIVTYGINVGGTLYPSISYDSDNTGYYVDANSTSRMNTINADALRSYSYLYLDSNYGHCTVGLYDSYRYQGIFAMGSSYILPAAGTSLGNHYGLVWSHPNTGGAAGNLTDHGLLVINAGTFRCAISNSIVASGNITAYSDERLKKNWRDMPENFVARLAQVKVGIYDRIDEEDVTQVGVSAQSLQNLLPQAIMTAKDDMQTLSVSYGNAAMASAVELAKEVVNLKELSAKQQKQVEDQSSEISELKSMINILVDKINKLIN